MAARARLPGQRRHRRARRRGRGRRAVPGAGRSAAARWTSRSTASWSRSTTSSCSAASASSGATRAGRSPGSSRPRPRSRRCTAIDWNVGKYGDLHPFAELEPVAVGGVTVKLATLHNEEDLARKDIRVGDEVIVLRAGDVIPQVLSPAPHAVERPDRSPPPEPPERCPSCGTPTVSPRAPSSPAAPTAAVPRAQLSAAQALRLARARWTSRAWGRSGSRRSSGRGPGAPRRRPLPPDPERLLRARRLRRDSRRAASSRRSPLARAAVRPRALRAGHRGRRLRHRAALAQQFRSIDALLAASPEDIAATPGIGPIVAELIHDAAAGAGDARADRRPARPGRCSSRRRAPRRARGALAGRTFVLTGTLPDLTREEATERIVGRRRPRDLVGLGEDGLRRGRRVARVRSSRRPSASASRCSTRPACSRCLDGDAGEPGVVAGRSPARHPVLDARSGGVEARRGSCRKANGDLARREAVVAQARERADVAAACPSSRGSGPAPRCRACAG